MPDVVVEVAFNAGVRTPAASRVWTDVSAYVELAEGIEIGYGRQDKFSTCDANTLSLTLDNRDGRFTAGLASGAHYPNVKVGRPIRVTATRVGGAASTRFVGFVDEWPVEWNGTDVYAKAVVKASSRLARLGGGHKLRSIVEEQCLTGSPAAYYTMGEVEGAIFASDSSGNGASVLGVQLGVVAFGTATGPGTDGLTAATLTGATMSAENADIVTAYSLMAFFSSVTTPSGGDFGTIVQAGKAIVIDPSTGILKASASPGFLAGTGSLLDGATHHAAITHDGATLRLYQDGVLVDSDAEAFISPTGLIAGSSNWNVTLAHICYVPTALSAAQIADIAAAGAAGFVGETPGVRIARYATYADIPAVEVDADAGASPMAHVDTTGKSALEALRIVETTEGGVLHDGRDGTLEFRGRSARYLAASSFTLSFATQQIEADFRPVVDRSEIQNDVTATNLDGTVTARALNQASVDDYDSKGDDLELATTDVNEPHAAAWWTVNTYAEPRPRVPALAVDLLPLTGAMQDSVLAADVGTRFATAGAPAQAAAAAGDYFVEGYTETIGPESYFFTFNVSDASAYVSVWVLDSATRSQLDTTTKVAY